MGVVAHAWNGTLIIEAPVALEETARTAITTTGRKVHGILGAYAQTSHLRSALALNSAKAHLESKEELFALELSELRIPSALTENRVKCRCSSLEDLDQVAQWRKDYDLEAIGVKDTKTLLEKTRHDMEAQTAAGDIWLLEVEGRLVSMSTFNAQVPDCVQVGGVWTPHEHRSRGYAQCEVAGSLSDARRTAVTHTILFTEETNLSAQKACLNLGYSRVGDYGLVLFEEGQPIA